MCRKTGPQKSPRFFPFLLLLLTLMACSPQEQDLPFETIAKSGPPSDTLGMTSYTEKESALLIIAQSEEIDDLTGTVLVQYPQLTEQLLALDYDSVFVILALHGYVGSTGYSITVQKVTRQGNQVTAWAEFVQPGPETRINPAFTSPYHVVAVSKNGDWGKQIRFVLMDDDKSVTESQHFIP